MILPMNEIVFKATSDHQQLRKFICETKKMSLCTADSKKTNVAPTDATTHIQLFMILLALVTTQPV